MFEHEHVRTGIYSQTDALFGRVIPLMIVFLDGAGAAEQDLSMSRYCKPIERFKVRRNCNANIQNVISRI